MDALQGMLFEFLAAKNFQDNTLYYFFSTSAQSIGAVVAVLATLLLFKIQNIGLNLNSRTTSLAQRLQAPILLQFLLPEEREILHSQQTDEDDVKWAKVRFSEFWQSKDFTEFEFKPTAASGGTEQFRETNAEGAEFLTKLKIPFGHHTSLENQLNLLRKLSVRSAASGLTLVLFGMYGTLLMDLLALVFKDSCFENILINGYLFVYLISATFYLIWVSNSVRRALDYDARNTGK